MEFVTQFQILDEAVFLFVKSKGINPFVLSPVMDK